MYIHTYSTEYLYDKHGSPLRSTAQRSGHVTQAVESPGLSYRPPLSKNLTLRGFEPHLPPPWNAQVIPKRIRDFDLGESSESYP